MKLRHFYLLLIILLGEGIIITAFKHFGKGIDENVLNSNIIIASLIFILFAIELVNPIINIKDEAQSSIGGIGIRWTFSFIFVAGSISVMAYSIKNQKVDFTTFWLIESALIMILVLGLYFSRSVTEKVSQVYFEEKKLRSNLIDIKAKIEELKFLGQTEGELLQNHNQMLDQLLDNLRYLSPSNNERAVELESSILLELSNIQMAMKEGGKANEIQEMLMRCDLIYRQRKQLYSK